MGQKVKYELLKFWPAEGWHDPSWSVLATSETREGLEEQIKRNKRARLVVKTTTVEWQELER